MSQRCFIHSSTDGYLGCFHNLAIVNNAAMNTVVLMFFWISILGSFGYIPRSGITESKSRSIFNFWRYLHTAFHSVCTSLHTHQQCKRFPFLHIFTSTFFFVNVLMVVILTGVRWYVIVILICISLIISYIEHFFICLLPVCMSFMKKCLFQVVSPFFLHTHKNKVKMDQRLKR